MLECAVRAEDEATVQELLMTRAKTEIERGSVRRLDRQVGN